MSEKEFNKTNFSKSILGTTVRGYNTSTENKKLDKGRFIKPLFSKKVGKNTKNKINKVLNTPP